MEAVKINQHTSFIKFDPIWRIWNPRFLYLPNNRRHSFCPSCSQMIPWPEQLEIIDKGTLPVYGCDHCNALMRYNSDTRMWHFQESSGIKENTCPECGAKKEKVHESLPGFYICEHCNVEFKYTLGPNKDGLICTKFKKNEAMIMITKTEMNKKYATPDPFGVQTDPADAERKRQILNVIDRFANREDLSDRKFLRALDIGCGEGWITKDINAYEIWGYEISDIALSRTNGLIGEEGMGERTLTVASTMEGIEGKFDLILVAGCLVEDYDYRGILALIEKHACGIVITCSTDITEVKAVHELAGDQIEEIKFPYRENNQILRVFNYYKVDGDQNDSPAETKEDKASYTDNILQQMARIKANTPRGKTRNLKIFIHDSDACSFAEYNKASLCYAPAIDPMFGRFLGAEVWTSDDDKYKSPIVEFDEDESPIKEGSDVTLSDGDEEKFSGTASEKPLAMDAPIEVNIIDMPINDLSELGSVLPHPDLSKVEDISPEESSGTGNF